MRALNLAGDVYGRLTVLSSAPKKGSSRMWLCCCTCGKFTTVSTAHLRSGHTKSCGCLQADMIASLSTSHHMCGSREYRIWQGIKSRCYREKDVHYEYYGGRGIKMCDEWLHSFESFYADMGTCPDGMSLDRINPNGNYTSENCRWADNFDQARNRRKRVTSKTSKYKGVYYHKASGKFCSKVGYLGKEYWIGTSTDPKYLAEKFDDKVFELTGSWVGTNEYLGLLP